MGVLDNINQGDIPDILRRLRALENRTTLNNSAIGRGGMEVYDGGVLNISNGGLRVVGSGTFEGTLYADGTVAFTGDFSQSGPSTFTGDTKLDGPTHINGDTDITGDVHITGPTHLDGATDITGALDVDGTLDINGVATLNNDLIVQGGGQIKAGNVNVTPDASNGGIEFTSGGGVGANGGTVVVKGTGNAGLLSSPTMTSIFTETNSVDVTATAVTINGPLKATALPSTTNAPNLYFDPVTKQISYKP